MQILASVSKSTQGRISNWHFCQDGVFHFALRTMPTMKVVECKDMDDLRGLYETYTTKYDFVRV